MHLPTLNAVLNGVAAILLISAWVAIRRGDEGLHKRLNSAALLVSAGFLTSYMMHHAAVGHTVCVATGGLRTAYMLLLWPHVVLAALMVPLILITFALALLGKRVKHRKLARLTLPIWLYVSVTGVGLYVFIYHAFPGPEYFQAP